MNPRRFSLYTAGLLLVLFASCHKAGTGGEAILNVHILKTGGVGTVPGCHVYLKYDARDYPGSTLSDYDENIIADYGGHAQFTNLRKGYYYVLVTGRDTTTGDSVSGSVPYDIRERVGERHIVVEVH